MSWTIHPFESVSKNLPVEHDVCTDHKCSHICLPDPHNKDAHVCLCPDAVLGSKDGFKLDADGAKCLHYSSHKSMSWCLNINKLAGFFLLVFKLSSLSLMFEVLCCFSNCSPGMTLFLLTPIDLMWTVLQLVAFLKRSTASLAIGVIVTLVIAIILVSTFHNLVPGVLHAFDGMTNLFAKVAMMIRRKIRRQNIKAMNFTNPVYRKQQTDDDFGILKNQSLSASDLLQVGWPKVS